MVSKWPNTDWKFVKMKELAAQKKFEVQGHSKPPKNREKEQKETKKKWANVRLSMTIKKRTALMRLFLR